MCTNEAAGESQSLQTRIVAVAALLIALVLSAPVQAQAPEIDALRARAEDGDGDAQNNLGVMCAYGFDLPQDYAEAVRWYRLAAEQGEDFPMERPGFIVRHRPRRAEGLRAGTHVVQPRGLTIDR